MKNKALATVKVENKVIPTDGIEVCEDKCKCGGQLRLHTYTFNRNKPTQQTKFYIDCDSMCGRVSEWHNSPEKAIEAFDKEF